MQFREKGAVELGGLILVEIGRGNAGRALSLSIYRLPSKPLREAAGKKTTTMSKEIESSFFSRKENRSAGTSREGEGRGEWKEGQGLAWWWW